MKKTYISPVVSEQVLATEQLLANSITEIGGDSGIEIGDEEPPAEADTKKDWGSIWD